MQLKERHVSTDVQEVQPFRVLFVCTGNTCRSPMAEAVANAWAHRQGKRDLRAYSAGLFATEGEAISPYSLQALEKRGIEPVGGRDYRRHTAHNLSAEEVSSYDLLVGMTDSHVMQLMMCFPQVADRIVRMPLPISDPYGGSPEIYEACLEEIVTGIGDLLFSGERI